MISFVIIHWNRPYFLDLYIQMLRRFGNDDWQIIIADSNSEPFVKDRLNDLDADYVHYHDSNDPSSAIMTARQHVKNEYYVMSEEDFVYMAQPLTKLQYAAGFDLPDIDFSLSKKGYGYNESIEFMKKHNDIKMIKMATRKNKFGVLEPDKNWEIGWGSFHRINNYPTLMRTEEALQIKYPPGLQMSSVEAINQDLVPAIWGEDIGSYIYNINAPFHSHMGGQGLSVNPIGSEKVKRIREESFARMPRRYKAGESHRGNMLRKLAQKWSNGSFKIDIDEIMKHGLKNAWKMALKEI